MKLFHKGWTGALCLVLALTLTASLLSLRADATAADDYEATMLGSLSEKYEASGDPGRISSGEGDPGGKSYGAYQFASKFDIPKAFFLWCQGSSAYKSIGNRLAAAYVADGPNADAGDSDEQEPPKDEGEKDDAQQAPPKDEGEKDDAQQPEQPEDEGEKDNAQQPEQPEDEGKKGDAQQPEQPKDEGEKDDAQQPEQPEDEGGKDDAQQPEQPEDEGGKNDAQQPEQPDQSEGEKDDAQQPEQSDQSEDEGDLSPKSRTKGELVGAYGENFDAEWTAIAEEFPELFLQAQYAYTRKTYYDGAIAELQSHYPEFDIHNYSIALRNVIYSRSVQIGVGSVPTLFAEALDLLGGSFVNQPETELIRAIYEANSLARVPNANREDGEKENVMVGTTAEKYGISGLTLDWFWGSSSDVQLGVYSRLHINEPAKAQQMLADYGYTDAPVVEGIYQFSPQDNAALTALVSGSSIVINAPDEKNTNHQFRLVFYASGYYTITSVTTGLRLTGNEDGTLTFSEATAHNNQLWKLEKQPKSSRYSIQNRATGLFLSASSMSAGGTVIAGTEASLWQVNKSAGAWTLSGASYPSYANGLQVGESSYQFLGTLRCSYPILTVTARVLNSKGEDAFKPATATDVNALTYDLSNMNTAMAFSRLGAGAYTLVLTATADATHNNTFELRSDFYVSDGSYLLVFDAGKGKVSETSRDLLPGQAYGKLPKATRSGYIFLGWYTAAEGGEKVSSGTIMTAGNQTVYARYTKALKYAFVNYDGSTVYSGELKKNAKIPEPPNTPTRPADETHYYVFSGWEGYTKGMKIQKDITFNAVYEAKELAELPEMDSGSFVIRDEFLRSIPLGTTAADLLADLVPAEHITLHAGTSTATDIVGTGMTVEYKIGDEVKQTLTIVVTGDVNGDGKITITDLVQINSHLLKKNELSGANGSAADVSADGKITISDLVQINSHLLKRTSVTPN